MSRTPTHPPVLTIAGSDPSGGAGLQADLKTFHQHACYGMAVVSLLTVQNTVAVDDVRVLDAAFVARQLDAVLADIPPRAVKTGALGSAEIVRVVAARQYDAPLVVDPVLVSTHGASLAGLEATAAYREALLPHATVVTPNRAEAAALAGLEVVDIASMREAARLIAAGGARAVLVKGGDMRGGEQDAESIDVLYLAADDAFVELRAPRVATRDTHGTGCTLAAAIAARLAHGDDIVTAVRGAKAYLSAALAAAPRLGAGHGPVGHWATTEDSR